MTTKGFPRDTGIKREVLDIIIIMGCDRLVANIKGAKRKIGTRQREKEDRRSRKYIYKNPMGRGW